MIVILKSLEEIEKIYQSSQIVAKALTLIKENAKSGVTTLRLNKLAEEFAYDSGAKPSFKGHLGYPYSICSSINEEVVHGMPSRRPLKSGDLLSVDFGVVFNGYHGDSAITFPIGEVSEKTLNLIRVGQECLYKGISQAISNNRLKHISRAIQKHAEENSYNIVRQFVGHGIGRELHEYPQVYNYCDNQTDNGLLLKVGMVLAIEPMIAAGSGNVVIGDNHWTATTVDKKLAVHWEHTIAITKNGPKILSIREEELGRQ
jgi:methionyl aminopeptidase